MPTHGPPSPSPQPNLKRQRQSSAERSSPRSSHPSPAEQRGEPVPAAADVDAPAAAASASGGASSAGAASSSSKAGQSSNFRNVSACNRCRLRKNRCDQKLPSCASCAKAGVACVGYDPITKKEIPRSYVFYLETRVEQLEKLLASNNIAFPPAQDLETCSRSAAANSSVAGHETRYPGQSGDTDRSASRLHAHAVDPLKANKSSDQSPAMANIVSSSKPRSLASASGVSFARVVSAAVQYSVSDHHSAAAEKHRAHASDGGAAGGGTSMRDSFFGLHTKPTIKPASFPDRDVATRLVSLYFEHANPQIPILHRGEFMRTFERAYASGGQDVGSEELYMLNMVFAIGCGVIVGEPVRSDASSSARLSIHDGKTPAQPEEYHASAIVHLEARLSRGGLGMLQAVLLLANFALLRPVPPGLWYITGVAVRLAVDLGLHYEDAGEIDQPTSDAPSERDQRDGTESRDSNQSGAGRGRRLWIRDMKRRLWWCTYSLDRLVSTCVGRPFGISDQVITRQLPSILDDDFITLSGFLEPQAGDDHPSYKRVAHHYFRLRVLQSEILQVLQYNQAKGAKAQNARVHGRGIVYPEMNREMNSPYLEAYNKSFRLWRADMDRKLWEWKSSAPLRRETGVEFSTEFLELNYWQAIILLYRHSLSVPTMFEGEYNPSNEINSPTSFTAESREDEDRIYIKVAEAGQRILRIYRQLHLSGLVSYTYLSTHHLFMAGISYLYAIWHSPVVRSQLTMDAVDFTVLAAKSVFSDMIDKCPPAETCRDAFDRTAKATIKMATSNGGFGVPTQHRRARRDTTSGWSSGPDPSMMEPLSSRHRHHQSDHQLRFNMSLSDNLSPPNLSTVGDISTPPLGKAMMFDSTGRGSHSGHVDAIGHERSPTIDPSLVPSASLPQRINTNSAGGERGEAAFINQAFNNHGSMEYGDVQSMDFLQQTLGSGPNGDFGGVEEGQMDLSYSGFAWDDMKPFTTFYFGNAQGGNSGSFGG